MDDDACDGHDQGYVGDQLRAWETLASRLSKVAQGQAVTQVLHNSSSTAGTDHAAQFLASCAHLSHDSFWGLGAAAISAPAACAHTLQFVPKLPQPLPQACSP